MPKKKNDDYFDYNGGYFEDISSSSEPIKRRPTSVRGAVISYENGIFRNIGKIIKIISFVVAIAILLVFVGIAVMLVAVDKTFIAISIGVVIIGAVIAAICLFLIYGTGHIITQNDEIIRRL